MSGRIQLLGALFALQLLMVAGFLYVDAAGSSAAAPSFLEFVVDDVDRLVISGEGERVELNRTDTSWKLVPADTPADGSKIVGVLEKLGGLSAAWPVATSEDSRERFEVTADAHQRHVQIFAGDTALAELYLGTSPGFRRVHARAVDSDEVYSIDFSTFEVPLAQDDWLDKDLLKSVGAVTEVTRDGAWTLRKSEEGWLLGAAAPVLDAAEPTAADQDSAESLVERLTDLRVTGFAAEDARMTEKGRFTVTDDAGGRQLRFYHDEEEDAYAVESDRIAGRYSVAAYVAEQVIVDADALRRTEEAALSGD